MKNQLKVAIFGLSLNVLDNIKYKLSSMCEDLFDIHWVNIGDPQLEILLVNDMFFGSPTIQNLVSSKQIPYLRLISKNDLSGSIVNDTMYLPFMVNDQIRNWFNDRYAKVPLNYKNQKKVVQKKYDLGKVVEELLNERNGNLQVFDQNGPIALVNTRTEQVWLDHSRKIQGTDETINYTYATMHMTQSVSAIQGDDLRAWLWNMLWYSTDLTHQSSPQKYYRLQYWPHTNSYKERAQIFKIAAGFERGASISQIVNQFGIATTTVQKFVDIGLMTKVLNEIAEQDAQFVVEQVQPSQGIIKGFFGKLRKKLGL